ncbi:hypothetical protein GQX73_g4164 [Xylaria multiplex]|uniref:PNPLA domain-containing protein n=1 Tax=Xylaria multiplex TaxID=323545 RepID=A0A7C8IQ31_9PEZI|nr:hypothetical protein GQX73_g4164 [Xylaria multiplex]
MVLTCEVCDTEKDLNFCTGCNEYYCNGCWGMRRAHRDGGQLGPGGIPHEQVSPNVVQRVDACVAGPENEVEERKQHEDDQDTTWFGLDREEDGGDPVLSEYRRYAAIMMANSTETSIVQYPGLVSFVGQTNAGKSTLIRLLINPTKNEDGSAGAAAPVVGRGDSELPTSADVHLYADPESFSATQPILFADCEGFEGGERNPVASGGAVRGSQSLSIRRKAVPGASSTPLSNHFRRLIPAGTRRALAWARRDAPDREKTSKRQYAVSEMYPRIFYAFSDVIVFVLNNPKTMEDVVEKLLAWADANRSKSVNLPTKPHAIIALNKCPNSTPDALWNTLEATDNLYKSMNSQIQKNNTFQAYVKKWESARVRISDMEELFRCYYSKVHVIRIPDKSRYKLLEQQRDELYSIIRDCCSKSFMKKKEARILPDTDEFGIYISLAFDHFSQTLEEPFDYVKASLRHQPPLKTIADKLYAFAKLVAQRLGLEGGIEVLFTRLTEIVASCLMLDAARKRLFGQPDDWFKAETRSSVSLDSPGYEGRVVGPVGGGHSFKEQCQKAIVRYFNYQVPCQFRIESHNRFPMMVAFDCQQRRATHGEMHRSSNKYTSDDWWGEFKHDFDLDKFNWPDRILGRMEDMQKDVWCDNGDSRQARVLAHGRTLKRFYKNLTDDLGIFSNSICLCCLSNPPDHELSCGHVICLECAKDFGRVDDYLRITVDQCPMHDALLRDQVTRQPTVIAVQPPQSGLRVLVLDGGGVRGIVELSVLRVLEPDSTGGIISLGFGHELWSIEECIERFRNVISKAFTPRKGQDLRGIRHLQLFIKRSKYETKPIEGALRASFGEGNLFGNRWKNGSQRLKVAVAAVSEAGTRPIVLSNYNTSDDHVSPNPSEKSKLNYERHRPTQREDELKVWEAARATSAAPGFFRPFVKPRSLSPGCDVFPEMMDGAILHNNPINLAIEEARKLASAQDQLLIPDLVLSVGTGLPKHHQPEEEGSSKLIKERVAEGKRRVRRKAPFIRTIFTMISYQIQLNLDSERRWIMWSEPLLRDPRWKDRLFRFNPDFGEEPPPMDDVGKIQSLSNNVAGWMENHTDVQEKISQVACSLVASSFYFERVGRPVQVQSSSIQVHGRIRCRLQEDSEPSEDIRALGAFFASCHSPAAFVIEDLVNGDGDQRVEVPVNNLRDRGLYVDIYVDIVIPSEATKATIALDLRGISKNRRMFNISGFPRPLM